MGDPILKPNIEDMVHHLEHLFGEPTAQSLFTTAKDGACSADRPRPTAMDARSNLDFELNVARVGRRETLRMSKVLMGLGMKSTRRYVDDVTVRAWVRDLEVEP